MESAQLNEWITLAANIAVLVGIAFLIVEIRQNTESHRSDSRKAQHANDQIALQVALENPDIFSKMLSDEKLSQVDQFRLSFIFAIDIRNREFEYFQYRSGALNEATWKSYRDLILANHTSGKGRIWWDKVGRGVVNDEFEKLVDDMLAAVESDDTYDLLGNWDEGNTEA